MLVFGPYMVGKSEDVTFVENKKAKKGGEQRGIDVAVFPLHHFQSPDQTNVTSDTETPNINTQGHLEKIKRAGTGRGPIKKKEKKTPKTQKKRSLSFLHRRCEVVNVFTSAFLCPIRRHPPLTPIPPRHPPFPHPPPCLSFMAVI